MWPFPGIPESSPGEPFIEAYKALCLIKASSLAFLIILGDIEISKEAREAQEKGPGRAGRAREGRESRESQGGQGGREGRESQGGRIRPFKGLHKAL